MSVDIRKGDLIKATLKKRPENTGTSRVTGVDESWIDTDEFSFARSRYYFEVLDRPLPPIDEELLNGVLRTYVTGLGDHPNQGHRGGIVAVINYLRQNDPILKENA